MSLWYNTKKQEYASDGKNGWLKAYCDKALSLITKLYTEHFAGLSNRHKAEDIDYDESTTVKQKIDTAVSGLQTALTNSVNMEKSLRETGDAELEAKINQEAADRETADTTLLNGISYVANILIPYKADAKTVSASEIDTVFDTGIYYIDGAVNPDKENELFMIVCNSRDEIVYQYIFYDDDMIRCRTYSNDSWGSFSIFNVSYGDFVNEVSQRKSADTALQANIDTKADRVTNNGFAAGGAVKNGEYGIVIGNSADGTGDGISIGAEALSGTNNIAIGYAAIAQDTESIAIGGEADASSASIQLGSVINQLTGNNKRYTLQTFDYRVTDCDNDGNIFLADVGNLSDLDTSDKTSIVSAINNVVSGINSEVTARENADASLQTNINAKADKKTATNGFIGGNNAEETDGGAALGNYAKTESGGAVGSEAESKNGFAGGYNAKATGMGACIGANSHAYHGGSAGSGAQAGNGFAGGLNAKCGTESNGADIDCIQLGTGTNGAANTLQVYDKRIVEADGSLTDVGALSDLNTSDKTSIVNAINSINASYADTYFSGDGLSLYWQSYLLAHLAEGGKDGDDVYYIPDVGILQTLTTDSKDNIVNAINELAAKIAVLEANS